MHPGLSLMSILRVTLSHTDFYLSTPSRGIRITQKVSCFLISGGTHPPSRSEGSFLCGTPFVGEDLKLIWWSQSTSTARLRGIASASSRPCMSVGGLQERLLAH